MSTSLQIMHLRSSPRIGSPERLILEQLRLLPEDEFSTCVASFVQGSDGHALLQACARLGRPAMAILAKSRFDPAPMLTLRRVFPLHRPAILCTHDYKADILGRLATLGTRIRTVAVFHGWTSESLRMKAYQMLDVAALKRMDRIAAVSGAARERLIRAGIPATRVTVILNGIDADIFAATAEVDPQQVRAALGLPSSARILASIGRLSREKGHGFLLEAFAAIAPDMPDVYLVLVGDGPERERLKKLAMARHISHRVVFAGFQEDVASILRAVEFLVIPSLTEGLPVVVLEAFACGRPVVATAVGGVPEVVRDGETGLLVPSGDLAGLSRAIRILLSDPTALERMGAVCHSWVRERFGIQRYVAEFADLFRQVANGG